MRAAFRNFSRAAVVLAAFHCLAEAPKDPGFVERAERTLVQLTVRIRVRAPEHRRLMAHLTKADLSVVFDDKEFPAEQLSLDNFCPEPGAVRPPEVEDLPKHVLFFVDTVSPNGRDNTKAMLQTMIPKMAADGYEMRILPGGDPRWSTDVEHLLRDASTAVEPWLQPEDAGPSPEEKLRALLTANEIDRAIELATEIERDAQLTFEGPSLRLARAISEMGPLPVPKALIYFAELGVSFREMIADTALQAGVAVYAVKADGLPEYVPDVKTAVDPGSIITTSLSALSEHTGGRFSLGHFRPSSSEKIMSRVESDLSCIYVVSLDATGLDRDRTLRPKIRLRSPLHSQLIAETVPDFMIPSEGRRHADALAIALRSGRGSDVQPGGVSFVPIELRDWKVTGLIQFTFGPGVDAPSIPASWDIGVNYFGASRFSGYGGIRTTARAADIVFEKMARIPVGTYSIVGVAQEVGGPALARGTAAGVVSRPKKKAVEFAHPPDVVQRRTGTFLSEGGRPRTWGFSPARFGIANSDRPTALVTALCRGAGVHGALTVETRWHFPGDETRAHASPWPELKTSPCRALHDDLPGAGLPWSGTPYEATVVIDVNDPSGRSIARASKSFWVIGPDARAPAP